MTFPHCISLIALLASIGIAHGAEPEIIFSGILTSNGKTHVALTDPATKGTRWVLTGNEFNGYSVDRYDPEQDAVFLKKGTQEIRLPLALAKTEQPARSSGPAPVQVQVGPPPAPQPASMAAAVRSNLRLLATAAQQFRRQHGVNTVSYADLVGPGKLIPELTPVAGENYSTLNFGPDVTAVSVTTVDGATIALELQPNTSATAAVPTPAAPAAVPPPATIAGSAAASPAADPAATPAATQPPPIPTDPAATLPAQSNVAATATPAIPDEPLPATGRQPAPVSYTVQGGDTLQSIAAANGVTVQQLQELNPTLQGGSLQPGEAIRIRSR